jgi:hypothetical protein
MVIFYFYKDGEFVKRSQTWSFEPPKLLSTVAGISPDTITVTHITIAIVRERAREEML